MRKQVIVILAIVLCISFAAVAYADDVPRMAKEQLLEVISDPNTIILDVRRGYDWDASEYKIKGAVREGSNINELIQLFPDKEKLIVLYCA